MRFERGADPEAVRLAADRAAELIIAWSGGTILAGVVEAGGVPARRTVPVRPSRIPAILGGAPVEAAEAERRLRSVGFQVSPGDDRLDVEVPGFRVDVEREIDLIEEIVRVDRGYERVESTLPAVRQAGGMPPGYAVRRRIREILTAQGLSEIRSPSFASEHDLSVMGDSPERAVRIANPLAADEAYLRTRLTPGLLRALQRNRSRNVGRVAIFEVGTVFRAADPVEEVQKVGFALMGPPGSWPEPARSMDFFDAKGVLESLMEGLGVASWGLGEAAPPPFHPGRSATVMVAGEHAGVLGEVHPRTAQEWDLHDRVSVGVLAVTALLAGSSGAVSYQDVPRLPPVVRDLAFVVDDAVSAGPVRAALLDAGAPLVGAAVLFDVFTGDPLPEGKKNLAFRVEFRAPDRTLTDEDVDEVVSAIAGRLAADLGATLRG
jgi:phenylalanyl-tRNA synthetase beta chain